MAKNYYDLLNLSARQADPSLSPAEVKAAYRGALLQHHPDKRRQPTTTSSISLTGPSEVESSGSAAAASVDDIALAYKTLSEPRLRAEYDRFLRLHPQSGNKSSSSGADGQTHHHTGLETVDLDDLLYDEVANRWTRSCRCGHPEAFAVSEAELEGNVEDGELIVGCRGCSLWLRVLFSVDG